MGRLLNQYMALAAFAMAAASEAPLFGGSRRAPVKTVKKQKTKLELQAEQAKRYRLKRFDFSDGYSCFALNQTSANKSTTNF